VIDMGLTPTSEHRLSQAHPLLQRVMRQLSREMDFGITCSIRTANEQSLAYSLGKSKAKFGQSPHNLDPSLAVDFTIAAHNGIIDWNNFPAFEAVARRAIEIGETMGIAIRWGADWDMDGITKRDGDTDEHLVDAPHLELANWKELSRGLPLVKG
jgi:peptidoglycan LD-endopeptidase CwlK